MTETEVGIKATRTPCDNVLGIHFVTTRISITECDSAASVSKRPIITPRDVSVTIAHFFLRTNFFRSDSNLHFDGRQHFGLDKQRRTQKVFV